MDRDLASKLFFASVVFALALGTSVALPLMASAVRQFGPDSNLCAAVPADSVSKLSEISGLDFASDAVFSGLAVLAAFSEADEEVTIAEFLAGGSDDPLLKVFSLVFGPEKAGEVQNIDFGDKFATVGAIMLRLLSVMPRRDLVRYALWLGDRKEKVLVKFPLLATDFGNRLLSSVQDGGFATRMIDAVGEGGSDAGVTKLLRPLFAKDAEEVKVTKAQYDELILPLFK
jgi:hypothetical protein